MKRIMQSLIIVAVGVMIVASVVFAESHGKMGKMCKMDNCACKMDECAMGQWKQGTDKMFKELNLTEEQKDKIKQNRKAQQEKMKNLRTQLMKKHVELGNKLSDPDVSRAGIEPIATELKALQIKMIDCRIDGIFAVKEILTPDQFAKFQEKMKEKAENCREQCGHKKQCKQEND